MILISRPLSTTLSILSLLAFLTFPVVAAPADTAPPVPASWQDLYTTLANDLTAFDTTLDASWNGAKYPVVFSGNLWNASADSGPQLLGSGYLNGIQMQLQELKAVGVQAVVVEVGFPMLYEPFFSSHAEYEQYVSFYQQVAAAVRALGLKLIVESTCLRTGLTFSGFDPGAYYATLDWDQYQQARAQTVATVAQTMHPDYLVVLEEPDTEAVLSGQTNVNTVAGATGMLSLILTSLQQAAVPGVKIGAGVGTWLSGFQDYIQGFVALPVDFIDMHVIPVNLNYLSNALTIASLASAAGKPVSITQSWLRKVRNDELATLGRDTLLARNVFNFWEPLDEHFFTVLVKLSYYTQMAYLVAFEVPYFWGYLPYDSATQNMLPPDALNQESSHSAQNLALGKFTDMAKHYYSLILPEPDYTPPSTPANVAGSSGQPTMAYLTWDSSTDNVGVAGYYVYRNGVQVASTAQPLYQDTNLTDATTYSYYVEAYDLGGNLSAPTPTINVTTWNNVPPTTPINLTATAVSTQQINLTWTASTGKVNVGGYHVFRGTSATSLLQVGNAGTTPSYVNYPLTPGTTYYFGVEAVDTDGNVSPMSQVISAATLAPPSAPVSVVATPVSTNQIELTWVAGASGMPIVNYHIFRGTSPSNLAQWANRPGSPFNDYPLTASTTYYYAIEEVDAQGDVSPVSAVVSATTLALPLPPTNVSGTALANVEIQLQWSPAQSGMPLTWYQINRGTSPTNLTQLRLVSPTATSAIDYPVTAGTTYYYTIQSGDTGGNISAPSPVIQVTTPN